MVVIRTYLGLVVMVIAMLLTSCATQTRQVKSPWQPAIPRQQISPNLSKNIRVALVKHTNQVRLTSSQPIAIYDLAQGSKIATVQLKKQDELTHHAGLFNIQGRHYVYDALRLVARPGEEIQVNGKNYRGQITLIKSKKKGMHVINILPLDDYLQGVVPNEVQANWPMEALKAQAVAARTFALYKMSGRRQQAYDLDASVYSQVYRGLSSEQASTNQAVQATKGQVAMYRGKLIAAFYHSNCGGHTANSRHVWGSAIAYLQGVSCRYCQTGPHFKWSYQISKKQLKKILNQYNYDVGDIKTVNLNGRDSSNRVSELAVYHQRGRTVIRSSAFRMALGADKCRSTNFYITQHGDQVLFHGRGWGHGVGLCQEGAKTLAKQGYSFQDIIHYYYPGSSIDTVGGK